MSFDVERKSLECKKRESSQDTYQNLVKELLSDESNKFCADCNAKGTQWASWNLGVFLCIRCAGIHRNLGVHISKVKSIFLDTWSQENAYMLQVMGNKKAKEVYEACLPSNFQKRDHHCNIESWIRQKYEYKKFMLKNWTPQQFNKKKRSKKKGHGVQKEDFIIDNDPQVEVIASLNSPAESNNVLLGLSQVEISGGKTDASHLGVAETSASWDSSVTLSTKGITLCSSLWQ